MASSNLSFDQRSFFARKNCVNGVNGVTPTTTRLVSSCEPLIMSDFVDNVFLELLFMGGKIKRIIKLVRCKAYPIFRDYITTLSQARASESSNILGKMLKVGE